MQNHGLVNVTAGPCPDHWPIELWLPKWGTVDLEKRLRKPKNIAAQGRDRRDFAMETIEPQWGPEGPTWEQWSQTAETWLRRTFNCKERVPRKRGAVKIGAKDTLRSPG